MYDDFCQFWHGNAPKHVREIHDFPGKIDDFASKTKGFSNALLCKSCDNLRGYVTFLIFYKKSFFFEIKVSCKPIELHSPFFKFRENSLDKN